MISVYYSVEGEHLTIVNYFSDNQRREIPMRLICYNIDLIARSQVESGRFTRQSLEAITA